jgi:anti-sigma B factor antagonist
MSKPGFEIRQGSAGEVVMSGRLDATQCDAALQFLSTLAPPRLIDLAELEYIASAGLRVVLLTQKRCKAAGTSVKLINVTAPVYDVFHYAGFDQILDISRAGG